MSVVSTPGPTEAVMEQEHSAFSAFSAAVRAHVRDVATLEFAFGLTVGVALVLAAVLCAHRVLHFRVRF